MPCVATVRENITTMKMLLDHGVNVSVRGYLEPIH
jgi:hypothetical protein